MRPLRTHQTRALDLLRQSLGQGRRRPMLQAPTGFGKTLLSAAVVDGAMRKDKRVVFCVPALSLVDQTVEAFWKEGIRDIGVIQGDHELTSSFRPVQIASVQTLMRRHLPDADVVVIDEAHRWFEFYGTWMANPEWLRIPFIGLSATPWTKGLGKHFDDLIIAATTADLIEAGYLSRFRVFAPAHPDLTGVRTQAGDYHDGDLAEAMNKPGLVADVVETWRKMGEDRPTFVFAVDRAHAAALHGTFLQSGIASAYVDANTDTGERDEIRKKFHSGEIKVVCNIGTMTTGVDWDVRCVVLARPTKSEMLFVQMIGRGLRTAAGKDDCLILDHSDTHLRLGFVTEIRHDKLNTGERPASSSDRGRKEALPKECPSCTFLKPAKMRTCPICGFEPVRQSTVVCEDGDLLELTAGKSKASRADKQRWYSMLAYIAQQRGYASGWVSNQYREKFGVWPTGMNSLVREPTADVWRWVKSRQIAFAKRRAA